MALTPSNTDTFADIGEIVEVETQAEQPSRTYAVNFSTNRIEGTIDGIDAVKQAIYMILRTKRFAYLIFSWDYGAEIDNLLGKSRDVLQSEIKRVITEALTADERITDVIDFNIKYIDKRSAAVEFTAVSIFGDVQIQEEVTF